MNRKQLPRSGESLIDRRPLGEPMSSVRLRRPKRAASFTLPCERSTELNRPHAWGYNWLQQGTTFGRGVDDLLYRPAAACFLLPPRQLPPPTRQVTVASSHVGERSVR
jgi:hypothetical protein